SINTAVNDAAIPRIWMIWRIGMVQKWFTTHCVSGHSDMPSAKSESHVDRSHSVILYNKSSIRELSSPASTPGPTPRIGHVVLSFTVHADRIPRCRVNYGNRGKLHRVTRDQST